MNFLNLLDLIRQNTGGDPANSNTGMPILPMPSFTPQHQIFDQTADLIANRPQMQDESTMSPWRKLGGYIVGAGAGMGPTGHSPSGEPLGMDFDPKASNDAQFQFMQAPYLDKMKDYTAQLGELRPLAQEEMQQNTLGKDIYGRQLIERTNEIRSDIAAKKADDTAKYNDARIKIQQQRADTYAKIANGAIPEFDATTNKMYIVHKDGTKDEVDANIFSPQEMQQLKDKAALQRVNVQQAGANSRVGSSGTKYQIIQEYDESGKPSGAPVRVDKTTGEVTQLDTGGKPIKPTPATNAGTTSTTTTEAPGTVLGSQRLGELFHVSPVITKSTTTVKQPLGKGADNNKPPANPKVGDVWMSPKGATKWNGTAWVGQ